MTAKTKFKSPAFEAIHSAAAGLSRVDAISAETMRTFDKACLTSVQDLQPVEIKALREKLKVSQPVFAHYLNTSVSTVQQWHFIKTAQHCAKTRAGGAAVNRT